MSFFPPEPPPPPRRPPIAEHRRPPWAGPPDNERPVSVPLNVVLARVGDLAAWVADAHVFSEGLGFTIAIASREPMLGADLDWPPFGYAGAPRFGIGFSDGRRAFVGDRHHPPGPPPGPVLSPRGGGASPSRMHTELWLWPLPPAGELTLAFAWDAGGIPESVMTIDAGPLLAGAAQVEELWPDDRPLPPQPGAPGWGAYGA